MQATYPNMLLNDIPSLSLCKHSARQPSASNIILNVPVIRASKSKRENKSYVMTKLSVSWQSQPATYQPRLTSACFDSLLHLISPKKRDSVSKWSSVHAPFASNIDEGSSVPRFCRTIPHCRIRGDWLRIRGNRSCYQGDHLLSEIIPHFLLS